MLAFIGLLYFATAVSYLLVGSSNKVFPTSRIDENAFNLYKNEGWLYR